MCVFRRLPGILSWNFAISTRAKLIASVEGEKKWGKFNPVFNFIKYCAYFIHNNKLRMIYFQD